ncbi:MAG: hypothetical protein EOM92_16560 [Gammaproteobacteria bacterium]|jgi:hypothetical protein|nr:hypothetical protein [Gammaproteobacteria bacterium]
MTSDLARIHAGQSAVLAELDALRSTVNQRLTAILAQEDRRGAEEANIVARWLDDGTIAARHLMSRAEGIARFLGGRTHG